jgi:hypothetical protein
MSRSPDPRHGDSAKHAFAGPPGEGKILIWAPLKQTGAAWTLGSKIGTGCKVTRRRLIEFDENAIRVELTPVEQAAAL